METTVYNPAKGGHETIRVTFDHNNTTWFEEALVSDGVYSITDINGDLLICELGYTIPMLLQEMTRAAINYNLGKARELLKQHQ